MSKAGPNFLLVILVNERCCVKFIQCQGTCFSQNAQWLTEDGQLSERGRNTNDANRSRTVIPRRTRRAVQEDTRRMQRGSGLWNQW